MSQQTPRPFAGRKMTRKQRRESERRARDRAAQLARAMPPPEQTTRVDPITGRPVYTPTAAAGAGPLGSSSGFDAHGAFGAPANPPGLPPTQVSDQPVNQPGNQPGNQPVNQAAPSVPFPASSSAPQVPAHGAPTPFLAGQHQATRAAALEPGAIAVTSTTPAWAQQSPTGRPAKSRAARRAARKGASANGHGEMSSSVVPGPDEAPVRHLPSQTPAVPAKRTRKQRRADAAALASTGVDQAPPRPTLLQSLLAPADPPAARWLFLVGLLLAAASAMVGVGAGAPVLGHETDWEFAALGTAGLVVGSYLAWIGGPGTGLKVRAVGSAVAVLSVSAFVVGVMSNPVIIDGQVLLSTSKEAKATELSDAIYRDLRAMARYDDLLVAPIEDARSNVSAYGPATADLRDMSQRYLLLEATELPDPSFRSVVTKMKTTAFWAAEAMDTKDGLIEQEDARQQSDLDTKRATFTNNWLASAEELKQITAALAIPYTTDLEGPHE